MALLSNPNAHLKLLLIQGLLVVPPAVPLLIKHHTALIVKGMLHPIFVLTTKTNPEDHTRAVKHLS